MLNLRKAFGSAFGPYLFSHNISEPATNLCNDLTTHTEWEEENMCSPRLDKAPPPSLLLHSIPYSTALPESVDVPIQSYGKMDVCTDDIIPVGLYNTRWKLLVGAPLLALHLLGRPLSKHERLPRDDLVAMANCKLKVNLRSQRR